MTTTQQDRPPRDQAGDSAVPACVGAVARGWVAAAAACVCSAGALALWGTAPALAVEGHTFSKSFNGGTEHALSAPRGVAINQSTGNVYVADSANNRVEIFSSSGAFASTFGKKGTGNGEFSEPTEVAVDNSGGSTEGDVAVVDHLNNRVELFTAAGSFLKQVTKTELSNLEPNKGDLQHVDGVAIDGSGDVWIYVEKNGDAVMYELPTSGTLKLVFENGDVIGGGLAIASDGDLWAGNGAGAVHYEPTGKILPAVGLLANEFAGSTTGAALDATNEGVYLDRGVEVAHFPTPQSAAYGRSDSFGATGSGKLAKGAGIAVNSATHEVYVADSTSNLVNVYAPVTLATASLNPTATVAETTAAVSGEVNPEGSAVSSCRFEYGEAGNYSLSAACSPLPGSGTTAEKVKADLTGLVAGEEYHVRLSVTDSSGTSYAQQLDAFKVPYQLKITTAGTGGGKVECEVGKSGDFEACASGYNVSTELALKATADAGSTFAGWSEGTSEATACDDLTGPCTFRMWFEAASITATFNKAGVSEVSLTVTKSGTGQGAVVSSPAGIKCEPGETQCAHEFDENTKVTLTATPEAGSEFVKWSGCDAEPSGKCEVTMTGTRAVTAELKEAVPPMDTLGVISSGTGTGAVECEVDGHGGFGACAAEYLEGTAVVVRDTPTAGSRFVGWSAGTGSAAACAGTGPCAFVITEDSSLSAGNNELAKFTLNASNDGEGEIRGSGIECGSDCSQEVAEAASVELTATAESGWQFEEWSEGPCAGSVVSTCDFAMPGKATPVTAKYAQIRQALLTVYVTGNGKVTSSPTGLVCSGEACTGLFEGPVTLTGSPEPGYVLAGWIGCRKTGADTCEVNVTAASEATAVFLKEGTEGSKGGEGPRGTEGPKGDEGAKGNEGPKGAEGPKGSEGAAGKEGPSGKAGAAGPQGVTGMQGPAGGTGPQGPTGPAGPGGATGKVELITCLMTRRNGKAVRQCTTKLVSGPVTFTTATARAMLSRRGVVYAAGAVRTIHGHTSLSLVSLRTLRPGRYTLTVISGAGRRERIRSVTFTLRDTRR
jgi:hypothetical protein